MRVGGRLRVGLLVVMLSQALGRVFPSVYRDVEWIRAAWFGNDWVTLAIAVFVWTLWALGGLGGFTFILSARGLWSLQRRPR